MPSYRPGVLTRVGQQKENGHRGNQRPKQYIGIFKDWECVWDAW
jgi:hypothetical protein